MIRRLVEPAVARRHDCTRRQTAWQVRFAEAADGAGCTSPNPAYDAAIAPSAGRLSTAAVGVPASNDPCTIAPFGGYRGLENRLYRVQIHDPGPLGTATFKWSRDNGAVASRISGITAGAQPIVTVERLGRDEVLRFHAGEWVELLDDVLELDGKPGLMRQVLATDPTQSTVTLTAPLTGTIDVTRNARLRRWDQTDDLTDGVVSLSVLPAVVDLGDGVEVTLSLANATGRSTPATGGCSRRGRRRRPSRNSSTLRRAASTTTSRGSPC